MKKTVKKIIRQPLEVAEEFAKEAKKQITAKAPAPEETLAMGTSVSRKQAQKIQQREEEELKKLRFEKAKMLPEWRRRYQKIQEEELRAAIEREAKEEEKKKAEELEKKQKEDLPAGRQGKPMPSGEEAIAATGTSQKRPTGLWGIGGRFKKMFKWATAERKGRAPR